jgi:hypothetical protein
MKFRGEKAKNHRKAQSLMSVKALQRARRRYGGEELPVTCFDEELTGETIYNITCDFERGRRLSLLASAIGSLVAVARPFEDRTQHMIDIPRLLRKHVKDIATIPEYCKRPIKNGGSGVAGLNVCGGFIDPSDISLADAAFDRALRRRAGLRARS